MMTVKQFAESRGIPIPTVYTWIKRRQASKNGFKVIKIGSVTMIREMRKPVAAILLVILLAFASSGCHIVMDKTKSLTLHG